MSPHFVLLLPPCASMCFAFYFSCRTGLLLEVTVELPMEWQGIIWPWLESEFLEKVFEIKGHVDSKGAPGGGAGAITTSGMFTMIGARVFFHMLPREGRLVEEVEKRFETSGKRGL